MSDTATILTPELLNKALGRVLSGAPDVYARFDRRYRRLFLSASVTALTGSSLDVVLGKTHRELGYPEAIAQLWEDALEAVFTTGLTSKLDSESDTILGHRTFEFSLSPETGPNGTVESVLAVGRDVTEERAIRRIADGLSRAVGEAFFPGLTTALREVAVARACAVYRFPPEEAESEVGLAPSVLALAIEEGAIGEGEPFGLEAARRTLEGDGLQIGEGLAAAFPGEPAFTRLRLESYVGVRLVASSGRVLGVLGAFHDRPHARGEGEMLRSLLRIFGARAAAEIERLESEEARRRLEARLFESQRLESLATLAGGIAHDFNNILTAIHTNLSMVRQKTLPGAPSEIYLEEIKLASQRADELCRQMLAYSGRGRFHLESLDLGRFLADSGGLSSLSIPPQAHLTKDVGSSLPEVLADAAQARLLLTSLLENAFEALPGGRGTVTIAVRRSELAPALVDPITIVVPPVGDTVSLDVADPGHGMDPAILARAFDPFYSTKSAGRGLGLAAVLGIVRGHRAGLLVSTGPAGSVFRVLFPVAPAGLQRKPEGSTGTIRRLKMGGTVLVVDDEDLVRRGLIAILGASGYDVLEARGGTEALEVLSRHAGAVDAVLVDLTMPGMTGDRVCVEILQRRPGTRVVLMSGYDAIELDERRRACGAVDFLQKPFGAAMLLSTLQKII
ncbi:MAG: response regulator [Acidobacteria bacterium]|nr:response regulator [Acidobacteriota bacterium]